MVSRKAIPSATRNECGYSRRLTMPGAAGARATAGRMAEETRCPARPGALGSAGRRAVRRS